MNRYYFGDIEADRIYCGDILFYEKKTTSYDSRLVWAIDAYRNELGKKRLVCYTKDGTYPTGWENLKYDDDGVFYDVSRSGDVNNIAGYITDDLKIYIGLPYEVGADGKPSSTGYVPQGRLKIPCEWNFETHTIIGQKLKGSGSSRLATYYGDFVQYYGLEFFDCYINGNIFKLTSGDDIYSNGFRGRHNAGGEIGYMKICTGGETYSNITDTFKRVLIYEGTMTEDEMQEELKKDIELHTLIDITPQPVQNGLVCWLDGRDGSGTDAIWVDRSGNGNSVDIINSLGHDNFVENCFFINGLTGDNYGTFNKNMMSLLTQNSDDWTIEFYIKERKTPTVKSDTYYLAQHSSGANGRFALISRNGYDHKFEFFKSPLISNCNYNIPTDSKDFTRLIAMRKGAEFWLFVNNEKQMIYNGSFENNYLDKNMTIGHQSDYEINCKFGSIRMYNRALTEAEIQQNYEYEQSIDRRVNKFVPRNDTIVLSSEILSNGDIVFTNIGGANSTRITLNGAISDGDKFSFTVIGDIPASTLLLKDSVYLEGGKTYTGIVGIDSYNVQGGNFRFNFTGFPFNSTFTLRDMIIWTP